MNVEVVRRERLPLLLFFLLSLALLALARPLGLPWPARAASALVCVFVIPGAALALLWSGAARGGWPAVAALATPLSLLPVLAAGAFGRLWGWSVLPLGAAYLFGVFVVTLASLVLAWRREAEETPPPWASALFLSVVLAAVFLVARAGAPVSPGTDGPDHVATVNEILGTGEFFPRQGLVPPGEVDRTDPRKGVFSIGLALAAVLADVPARSIWRAAPAVLVVSWLSGLLVLGLRVGLRWRAAILAAGLAFLFVGGAGGAWAVRLGYGAHLGLAVAWVSTGVLLELARDLQRSGVILFGVLTLVAAAVHPMAPAFVFLPAVFMILLLRRDRIRCLRIAGALVTALVIAAPVLIWRLSEVMGGVNPLHRQTMGVLTLGPWVSILWPFDIYRGIGWLGLLGLVLVVPASRSAGDSVGRTYLRAAAAASILFAVVPGLFDLASRLTSSLPIKLLYLNPFFFVLAALVTGSWKGRGGWLRPILAILIVLALPGALDAFSPGRVAGWRPAGVDGALEMLRAIPGREVVAADPWVSSLIAAETPHDPITVLEQHGHPLDPSGLSRLNTLDAILSPSLSGDDARARMRAAHARYVLVPDGEDEPLLRGFDAVAGGVVDAARLAKFAEAAPIFVPAGRAPGWHLFRATDTGEASGRPPVWPPVLGEPRGDAVAVIDGSASGVRLRAVQVPAALTRGREAILVLWWTSDGTGEGWPVEAHLKLRPLDFSGLDKANRVIGIVTRRGRGAPGPLRVTLAPFLGAWPAASWPREAALADSQRVVLPADLPPGRYVVSMRVVDQPMFAHIAWRDIWSEQDQWQGAWIDTVEVR